jgi:O-antigen/teichoic acid export membrane protein
VPTTFILRNVFGNALSILSSDVMNRATSFVIYALVARHLGAREFGQLSLAFSLFYVFQVFAISGLKVLIIREVAKERSHSRLYFINSSVIAAVSSTASLTMLMLLLRLLHYPPATSLLVLLLAVGLFPTAISAICEGIFQAWERMHLIAVVNVPVNLGKIFVAYLLLTKRPELYGVVVVLLSAFFVVATIETWIVLRRFPEQKASVDPRFAITTFRNAVTFLGIDGTIAVESSLIVVFLSKLASVTEVGLYNAALQVMVPMILVYQSMAQSIFPLMCHKVEPGLQNLKHIAVQSVELLLMLAVPAVAGIFFLSKWVLSVFYRNPVFLQAAPILRIMAWTLMLQVFTSVLGQVLLATHREKITLRIAVTCTLVNLLIGWPLIKLFGLSGAAVTLLINRLAGSVQHYVPVSRLVSGIPLGKVLWKPALAAVCMVTYLTIPTSQTGVSRGISATLIYGGALLAITVWVCGGPRRFKEKLALSENL